MRLAQPFLPIKGEAKSILFEREAEGRGEVGEVWWYVFSFLFFLLSDH